MPMLAYELTIAGIMLLTVCCAARLLARLHAWIRWGRK